LSEVTSYYRELYGLLSQQAMRQVDRAHLHLRPIQKEGVSILGDENLIRYLLEILRKQSGVKKPEMAFKQKNEQYVEVSVTMPGLDLSKEQPEDLFVPTREHIPFLICRQIVRDHGEATNRRGCGIRAENVNGCPTIFITLPSAAINNKTK